MKTYKPSHTEQSADVPRAKEDTFLGLAIAFAVLTGIGAFVAWIYVFWAPNWLVQTVPEGQTAAIRASAITPFLAVGAAVVTFFSVLWRGAINSRQAFEAKRQNDSKEEAELGLMLEKAASLLSEQKVKSKSAALAMLDTIATAPNDRYVDLALDYLTDEIVPAYENHLGAGDRRIDQIERTLDRCASLAAPRLIARTVRLGFQIEGPDVSDEDRRQPFSLIHTIQSMEIWNSEINLRTMDIEALNDGANNWVFQSCILSQSPESYGYSLGRIDARFTDCYFKQCRILSVEAHPHLCRFSDCEFSGAVFQSPKVLGLLDFRRCFFEPDDPPKFAKESGVEIMPFLEANKIDIKPLQPEGTDLTRLVNPFTWRASPRL
jgi:hypothetical protein